ncbi:unnamed protein product [Phyllotreta striolata]|uniref:Uncharacterized protein n=1 Tax=Phyllotreta striolata TaxID=444603 RepID=A0A9N9TXC9_PHYSR|nr:unnamed protein product [Phyllotreta striolata]
MVAGVEVSSLPGVYRTDDSRPRPDNVRRTESKHSPATFRVPFFPRRSG